MKYNTGQKYDTDVKWDQKVEIYSDETAPITPVYADDPAPVGA